MSNVIGMYRGKRVDGKGWLYGSLINNAFSSERDGEPITHIFDNSLMDGDCFADICDILDMECEVDPATVGQQTPFNCRYGQPLYQGMDVICTPTEEFKEEGQSKRTIGMSKNGQWVCFLYDSDGEEESAMPINWGGWRSIEIIKD